MAESTFNPDLVMSAAEEAALVVTEVNLLVDDLPKGMLHHVRASNEHQVAKNHCIATDASPSPGSSSAAPVSSRSDPMQPTHPPSYPTVSGDASLPASMAPAYARPFVAARSDASPTPLALAAPSPEASASNPHRPCATVAVPMIFPIRHRVVATILLPRDGVEAHLAEIFAEISALLCSFCFTSGIVPAFEATVGEPLRLSRRVYPRMLFSWPLQADAMAFVPSS
ncbi:unnamed protein product [Closterium sp. NIES-53]